MESPVMLINETEALNDLIVWFDKYAPECGLWFQAEIAQQIGEYVGEERRASHMGEYFIDQAKSDANKKPALELELDSWLGFEEEYSPILDGLNHEIELKRARDGLAFDLFEARDHLTYQQDAIKGLRGMVRRLSKGG